MYSFPLKNNKIDLDIIFIRVLFAAAATAAFLQTYNYGVLAIAAGLLFAAISIFVKKIKQSFNIHRHVFLIIGIVMLCLATQTFYFAFILILYFLLEKIFGKNTVILVNESGVVLEKSMTKKNYAWVAIEHIVLKDELLTISLTDNHFIQTEINAEAAVDEQKFNQYCAQHLVNKS
ncbi:hypothetical protein ACQ33O_12710 [Ferruginibacter sp. SUN002]|uniref:hypothetical protein n=1 Tax=Ferruginibacter sp. SUN002 TaxID=2937789 RepID=UPI003D35E539